jgi:hypothetical protein
MRGITGQGAGAAGNLNELLQGSNITIQEYSNDMTSVVIGPLEMVHAMEINDALKAARDARKPDSDDDSTEGAK